MPIDYNNISKLHRIKAWLKQRPTRTALAADSLLMTVWGAGFTSLGEDPTLTERIVVNAPMIAAALAVGYMHEKHKKTLSSKHDGIFTSKSDARKVLTNATAIMTYIDKEYGVSALEEALRSLERHILVTNHRNKSTLLRRAITRAALPTPGGFQLEDAETLPADLDKALAIVMNETITTYLDNYSNYADTHASYGNGRRFIPPEAQTYIVENHPELALKNPLLFSDEALDKHTYGLAKVVQTLVSMSCAGPAMREQIDAWRETKKPSNNNPDLPDDLLGFR